SMVGRDVPSSAGRTTAVFVGEGPVHTVAGASPSAPDRASGKIATLSPNRSGPSRKTQVRCPTLGSSLSFWYRELRLDPTHDAEVLHRGPGRFQRRRMMRSIGHRLPILAMTILTLCCAPARSQEVLYLQTADWIPTASVLTVPTSYVAASAY